MKVHVHIQGNSPVKFLFIRNTDSDMEHASVTILPDDIYQLSFNIKDTENVVDFLQSLVSMIKEGVMQMPAYEELGPDGIEMLIQPNPPEPNQVN